MDSMFMSLEIIQQAVPVQVLTLILYPENTVGQRMKRGMLETWAM
uniref:Alternative protein SOD1 n=1 Tax=Homo sapiens TaxID=9606 RepID=L8E9E6_HUMAN|nr:alternative protein SOD1 [Homo sapiens]